ncbi:hypothetical protein [Arsukibacterium tuosuense]|nr:hypothetical protein [Arsukibacterium tuosuense]
MQIALSAAKWTEQNQQLICRLGRALTAEEQAIVDLGQANNLKNFASRLTDLCWFEYAVLMRQVILKDSVKRVKLE